jgi:hypothetical protein
MSRPLRPIPWRQREAPAVRDSVTSVASREAILPFASKQRESVFAAIEILGEASDQEVAAHTGISPDSVRPRRIELVALGRIAPSGKGVTSSGRRCIRYSVVRTWSE